MDALSIYTKQNQISEIDQRIIHGIVSKKDLKIDHNNHNNLTSTGAKTK